jgi:hypothetical protein
MSRSMNSFANSDFVTVKHLLSFVEKLQGEWRMAHTNQASGPASASPGLPNNPGAWAWRKHRPPFEGA